MDVDIIGHGGYATSQELFLLDRDVLPLEPRLIVLLYVLNDADDAVYGSGSGTVATYYERPPSYLLSWLEGSLYRMSERRSEDSCPRAWPEFIHCAHFGLVEASFRRIGEISRLAHVPALVVIHPFLEAPIDGPRYPHAGLHEEFVRLARRQGMDAVDLRDAYGGYEVEDVMQDLDDPLHPNELGHRLVGTYLAQTIAARKDL